MWSEKQASAGIDIGNDGEQQRVGFQTYVPQRMSGFGGVSKRRRGREFEEFPELVASLMRRFPHVSKQQNAPECQAELKYLDIKPIESEIARFKKIAEGKFAEQFMTAPSPGIISSTMLNAFYDSHDAYLAALAREMKNEYQAIHKAGLILQIDAPDLAMDRTMMYRDLSDAEFVKAVERHVAAINAGIAGIPRERVRLHICYGNWEGPHIHDVPLATILPALYQATVGALSIEFSNPRHAHEYDAFKKHPLPKDMLLIPGVVETTSNFVEHPEVVARRIEEAVARGRRARAGDRRNRLRLRHLHEPRVGDRAGGVAQAALDPARRRHRIGQAVGQEGGVTFYSAHARGSGHPVLRRKHWVPAFAGTSGKQSSAARILCGPGYAVVPFSVPRMREWSAGRRQRAGEAPFGGFGETRRAPTAEFGYPGQPLRGRAPPLTEGAAPPGAPLTTPLSGVASDPTCMTPHEAPSVDRTLWNIILI